MKRIAAILVIVCYIYTPLIKANSYFANRPLFQSYRPELKSGFGNDSMVKKNKRIKKTIMHDSKNPTLSQRSSKKSKKNKSYKTKKQITA